MINLNLPESLYYGENEVNKKQFMKLYKSLKLKWQSEINFNGEIVSGWFNSDKSQYIIKHPEINHFKRLSFEGCDIIVDFFKNLGAKEFELFKTILPTRQQKPEPTIHFIGADLDSHYRLEEKLKEYPENFGVIWK